MLLLKLGAIGSACDILEQLEMWEDVIVCYQQMGKMEKVSQIFVAYLFHQNSLSKNENELKPLNISVMN